MTPPSLRLKGILQPLGSFAAALGPEMPMIPWARSVIISNFAHHASKAAPKSNVEGIKLNATN